VAISRIFDTYTINISGTTYTDAYLVVVVSSGTVVNAVVRVYAPQLETGSFATSYIPTTTAAVTRAADVAKVTGVSVGSAYTLASRAVLNAPYPVSGKLFTLASLGDGTANNAAYLARRDVSSGWQTSVQSGGSTVLNGIGGTPTSGLAQLALSASSTALTGVANGATIATGSGALPVSPSILEIGDLSWATPQAPVDGVVQRVSIYPTALTGSQLQSPSL
jgi:hypothetical protein